MIGAIAGAVLPSLVGGLFQGSANKKARKQFNKDRLYDAQRTDELFNRDRAVFKEDLGEARRHDVNVRTDARAYAARLTAQDRATWLSDDIRDRRLYGEDRRALQAMADRYETANVASRGYDLGKLRDQALASGFNPLTVLSAGGLGGYSTETGYSVNGAPYGGGGTGPGSHAASGGGAGGGGGGFQSSGGGYSREFSPALTSGSFVQQALERGIDTYFNTPTAVDPLADALRTAMGQRVEQEAATSYRPEGFGYDLTKQAAYSPRVSGGVPPMAKTASGQMPKGTTLYMGGIPVTIPPGNSSADDWEEQFSEPGGWFGAASTATDMAGKYLGNKLGTTKVGPAAKAAYRLIRSGAATGPLKAKYDEWRNGRKADQLSKNRKRIMRAYADYNPSSF